NTWTVAENAAKEIEINYKLSQQVRAGAIHITGPSTYLYVVGRKEEPCRLRIGAPDGWKVSTGLDEVKDQPNAFTAPDYDVLADNPISAGDLITDEYTHLGKTHSIVLQGAAKDKVDLKKLKEVCRHVTESQTAFFGGAPYNKYVWHFLVSDAQDGGWGLEHLSSTTIGLAAGLGPRIQHVIAHEFFHLWNVKRIRSKALGPFDYNVLPKTGALWFLEGGTDYYASRLMQNSGWWSNEEFYRDIVRNVSATRRQAARSEVSIYDSSLRVGEASNGRGNSSGFGINYYDFGWVASMLLDIEIRHATEGRRSLDDVTLALWDMTKNNRPGFEEDEIRNQIVRFGGPGMGPFYDKVIRTAGELAVDEQLGKAGLKLGEVEEPFVTTGVVWAASRADKAARVSAVTGPAVGKLEIGDLIVSVNGVTFDDAPGAIQRTMNEHLNRLQVGQSAKFQVKRGETTLDVEVAAAQQMRKVLKVTEDPNATPDQRKLREGWLRVVKPGAR
ncbi:MAG TPA: hypothetical protein VEX38_04450, partial [Fimbriimonadaceae bacterium]|nr:hypothetical protein [Fimbriimonadaceae bacterium]